MRYYQLSSETVLCRVRKTKAVWPNSAANPDFPPENSPKFRCRRLGQIASKGLIYRSYSPTTRRFSAAESASSLPTGKLAGLDPTRIDRDNAAQADQRGQDAAHRYR
jgi:hypothetical protein